MMLAPVRKVGKFLYNRAVVPIYDENYEYILGFTGRSIFLACVKSAKTTITQIRSVLFFPNGNIPLGSTNKTACIIIGMRKQSILESNVIILVESPGNVWRLEEAGIHNSVAIFGAVLNDNQKKLIDESGAMSIVCLLDNDEAGRKGIAKNTRTMLQNVSALFSLILILMMLVI